MKMTTTKLILSLRYNLIKMYQNPLNFTYLEKVQQLEEYARVNGKNWVIQYSKNND